MSGTNGTLPAATLPLQPSQDDVSKALTLLREAGGRRVSKASRDALENDTRWAEVLKTTREVPGPDKRAEQPRKWASGRATPKRGRILAALDAARPFFNETPDDPDPDPVPESETPKPFRLDVLGATEFARRDYRIAWHIKRVLVADQPCVMASAKKGMKTSIMVDMGVSLATGTEFLGTFDVPEPVPTLLLSGESGGFVLKDIVRRVCHAKGIEDWPSSLEGRFFIGFNLPQLSSSEQVAELARVIRENAIKVVVIDPLYLCLIGGAADGRRIDPANLFDMGPLFLEVSRACIEAGATPVLIHHFKLTGVQSGDMPELENMAYAGIQEFARQWILLGRREKFDPATGLHKLWLTVGGSAGHSGEWGVDISEGVMDDDFTGRTWEVSVRPASEVITEGKGEAIEATAVRMIQAQNARETAKTRQLEADGQSAVKWLRSKGSATKMGWRDALHWNSSRIGATIAYLEDLGLIAQAEIKTSNGTGTRSVSGWVPVSEPDTIPMLEGLE